MRSSTGHGLAVGILLFSGAIIISLLAMRSRAPQWLLMFCGGWTLFTLLNVTWQPLMVFQLALIWGGYAFLAPQGLRQRKFWKANLWEAVQNQSEAMKPAQMPHPEPRPTPSTASRVQPIAVSAGSKSSTTTENPKRRRLNKTLIAQVFIVILAINIAAHLYPFNYDSDLAVSEISRSFGVTLAIFTVSLFGLLFRPSKTLGMTLIAILIAPVMIWADRLNDPIAPQDFRELLHSTESVGEEATSPEAGQGGYGTANNFASVPAVNDGSVTEQEVADSLETNASKGGSDYQRYLDQFIKADPILSPETYDTSDMPATKAANAELARQRLDAANSKAESNEQPYAPNP